MKDTLHNHIQNTLERKANLNKISQILKLVLLIILLDLILIIKKQKKKKYHQTQIIIFKSKEISKFIQNDQRFPKIN